ncbi:hypothetical protein D3C80_2227930 [compost metagenome]
MPGGFVGSGAFGLGESQRADEGQGKKQELTHGNDLELYVLWLKAMQGFLIHCHDDGD